MSNQGRTAVLLGLLIAFIPFGVAFASTSASQEIQLCDFKVPKDIAHANASFTVIYAVQTGPDRHFSKIEKIKNDFLNDQPFTQCLSGWTLPVENQRVTITFNWKHGQGWTDIALSSKDLNQRIRIQPGAFKQYGASIDLP
jgi:hypothetical protein